jgi:hypothetical protein
MHETRQRAWRMMWLLLLLLPATQCEAVGPGLVGVWQGTCPGIYGTHCVNRAVKINIVQQCGNLVRGYTISGGTIINLVGSTQNGTSISLHGAKGSGTVFIIFGDYQAGTPPQINVSYLYDSYVGNQEYDSFLLTYAGPVEGKGSPGLLQLLLSD